MKRRFHLVPDVHLILEREGRVLLLERQNTGFADGQLGLVAGHLEGAETAREAMCREAYEEVGLSLHPVDLNLVHLVHRRHGREPERLGLFFRTRRWPGEPVNAEPEKCAGLHWCAWNRWPETVIPYVAETLRAIRSRTFYSEWGW